jgi:hypothetical protein
MTARCKASRADNRGDPSMIVFARSSAATVAHRYCAGAAFDVGEQVIDVCRRESMSSRGTHGIEFFARVANWLAAARDGEGLADPGCDRHVLCISCTLDFAVLRVLEDHLQPFSHSLSLNDSS